MSTVRLRQYFGPIRSFFQARKTPPFTLALARGNQLQQLPRQHPFTESMVFVLHRTLSLYKSIVPGLAMWVDSCEATAMLVSHLSFLRSSLDNQTACSWLASWWPLTALCGQMFIVISLDGGSGGVLYCAWSVAGEAGVSQCERGVVDCFGCSRVRYRSRSGGSLRWLDIICIRLASGPGSGSTRASLRTAGPMPGEALFPSSHSGSVRSKGKLCE